MRAVDKKTHDPLSGRLVSGRRKDDTSEPVEPDEEPRASKGDLEHPAVTDMDGRAELEVPSGAELVLLVRRSKLEVDLGNRFVGVPSLRPGERRELLVQIENGKDVRFFGRVVDAAAGSPIAGALARLCIAASGGREPRAWRNEELTRTTTDANGGFELAVPEWSGPFVRIESEGFSIAVLRRFDGHDSPERALVVQLTRAATLEAEVHDAKGGALPGVTIRLSADGSSLPPDAGTWTDFVVPDERWTGVTSADGTCKVPGLSTGIGIEIELLEEGRLVRKERDELKLDPGQVLHREWIIGNGATLNGVVLDQDSRPVADLEIWRTKGEPEPPGHLFQAYDRSRISDKTVTDGEGRFQFTDVSIGTWWIGPAAFESISIAFVNGVQKKEAPSPNAVAPTATSVEVLSAAAQDVTLHVHRGLYVRGKVLDPDGKPVPGMEISATQSSNELGLHGSSGPDGAFEVGPLAPGRYSIVALAELEGGRFANSDPVEADAGASDVVLRLKVGGGLHGRVIDSRTGNPCAAEMLLTPRVPTQGLYGQGLGFGVEENGIVEREGLLPGDYDLAARTEDGCFGILSGVNVVAGEKGKDFVLSVSPGGTLKLQYDGTHPFTEVRLRQQGVLLAWGSSVKPGNPRDMHAPAGTFAIETRFEGEGPFRTQTISLDPGEVKEVRLTDG